jgi:DNA-directed RNA polymerase II subunit RPB2
MNNNIIEGLHQEIIDKFMKENSFVEHHIKSCNNFYENDIKEIFNDMNPIRLNLEKYGDDNKKNFKYKIDIYIGGINTDKINYSFPIINNERALYPNECRLKNLSYSTKISYKIDIVYTISFDTEKPIKKTITYPLNESDYYSLGEFPIMLNSNLCILNNFTRDIKYNMGECRHDYGGYFIIDGKEKVIVPQERFGKNQLYIRKLKDNKHDYSVEILSVSKNNSKPKRNLAIRRVMNTTTHYYNNIVVDIPNVRKPIPLFILMRALGIISDKEIFKIILNDFEVNKKYMIDLIPCVHDTNYIFSQVDAINFIKTFTKIKSSNEVHVILTNYLLPHMSDTIIDDSYTPNYKNKAYFIGNMVLEMIKTIHNDKPLTDRDNYMFKRIETTGGLMKELFNEYSKIMYNDIRLSIEKEYYYNKVNSYFDPEIRSDNKYNIFNLIQDHYFYNNIIELGFRKGFKGDWGEYAHTKRLGLIQDLNRLSYNSFLSHLRKFNLNIDGSSKIVGPHMLHASQYGYLDPVDTPDGANVGLHKNMSMTCSISKEHDSKELYDWITYNLKPKIITLENIKPYMLIDNYKLFINGLWLGIIINEDSFVSEFILNRRHGNIPYSISIYQNRKDKSIIINSDEGRLIRPLIYVGDNYSNLGDKYSIDKKSWINLLGYDNDINKFTNIDKLKENKGIIEYIDSSEVEMLYISNSIDKTDNTHLEIHPSLMFGIMGNQVIFPENNPLPRNLFACGQAKQAVSLYHSNFRNRIDKMGVILNYGQKPLVRTRYFNDIHEEEHPYGENVIVAIMCHTSYNVEDAILINESAVKRGLFRTTYFNMYETHEEISKSKEKPSKIIDNYNNHENVTSLKIGYDYSSLDEKGLIKENTLMNDKKVVIGKLNIGTSVIDESIVPKKGQLGYVDKVFVSHNGKYKLAKIRIREDRSPAIGDKFCSRCGQKGTIGLLIPEENMPFTKEGLRPDIIVNPHALPSRMTIGQLIETITGKLCLLNGNSYDSTAFKNKGSKHEIIGKLLNKYNYNSKGNELLYNGITGEQIESNIFMGPTYYMRLKHMVKDKINYRAKGPRTLLTRQPVSGRANDGGLALGEMERDGVISHGMTSFLKDSMLNRGDKYKMAICNNSGSIAVYNSKNDMYYSTSVDGPLMYNNIDNEDITPNLITKYSKNFSIVTIPYSLKLLIQELSTINVQLRIITTDTIDKFSLDDNILKETKTNILNQDNKPEILEVYTSKNLPNLEGSVEMPQESSESSNQESSESSNQESSESSNQESSESSNQESSTEQFETGDASEIPVETGDSSEIPVETGDSSEIPVETGDVSEIPVETGDASEIPVETGDSSEIPVEIGDSSEIPVEIGEMPIYSPNQESSESSNQESSESSNQESSESSNQESSESSNEDNEGVKIIKINNN